MSEVTNDFQTAERICKDCGKRYLFRKSDYESFAHRRWTVPQRCISCRKRVKDAKEAAQKTLDDAKWQETKARDQEAFERQLESWRVIPYEDISTKDESTLCIIGNGFDMMHGVNSSYYSFRDSLGKNSSLRLNLEMFLTVDDIWADFEEALGHMNMAFFGSRMNADNWLDIMGAYEEDAGAAEFNSAAGAATKTVRSIVDDLQKCFYNWICTLAIGTDDRPVPNLFRGGKVLNFNYTEFVEDLYGVPEQNVCYIHGCRRKKKGCPQPKLVLGHAPGASDSEFARVKSSYTGRKATWRREMISAVQEIALNDLIDCDAALTKDCSEIIADHNGFFDSIKGTKQIITIGHSLSKVDWPYFGEIISRLSDKESVRWYFGCHGLRDLQNLNSMTKQFGIDRKKVAVFRTDVIRVNRNAAPSAPVVHSQKAKTRDKSSDGRWLVQTIGKEIQIVDADLNAVNYSVEFPANITTTFFTSDSQRLFLVSNGYPSGIFVFALKDDNWVFSFELDKNTDSDFLKRNPNRILLSDEHILFVYNNRLRKHSMEDGTLIFTRQVQGAINQEYAGEDVTEQFLKRMGR